jgi:hypothetical protein
MQNNICRRKEGKKNNTKEARYDRMAFAEGRKERRTARRKQDTNEGRKGNTKEGWKDGRKRSAPPDYIMGTETEKGRRRRDECSLSAKNSIFICYAAILTYSY